MQTAASGPFLTKIIVTLGPASIHKETIITMIEEGARVFRINFSHGTFEEHSRALETVRTAGNTSGVPVGIMGDLSGPKIRIGRVIEGGVLLKKGDPVEFQRKAVTTGEPDRHKIIFSTTYTDFVDEIQTGQTILLDDGNIRLICTGKKREDRTARLFCEVVDGGVVTSNKGINVPDAVLDLPSLTDKDYSCIEFAIQKKFDFLALSFVRSSGDVRLLKDYLRQRGAQAPAAGRSRKTSYGFSTFGSGSTTFIPVISKIEKPQALHDLEAILEETDGIMIARGDLGVEMDLAEVAIHQKRIIALCRRQGVPVIVATQMLQSMIDSPVPTRAEVSDVANAIFDGADAVMLSGESAVGHWPVESVRMMSRISTRTDDYISSQPIDIGSIQVLHEVEDSTSALAHGVKTIVQDLNARLIIIWSRMGGGAAYLSQQRIPRPIIAFSSNHEVLRRMSLLYGLGPVFMEQPENTGHFIKRVERYLLEDRLAGPGDPIVVVLGEPIERTGRINKIVVHHLGEST